MLRVEFNRLINTGDGSRDLVISPCTTKAVIWGVGSAAPTNPALPAEHIEKGGVDNVKFCNNCDIPDTPLTPRINSSGSNWVVVTWETPADTGGFAINSFILRARSASTQNRSFPGTTFRANITVNIGMTYGFSVQAVSCVGSSQFSDNQDFIIPYPPGTGPPPVAPPTSAPVAISAPVATPAQLLYTSEIKLLDNRMTLRWGVPENSQAIYFQIECRTSGWVGLGHGGSGMINSDIVIGWVDLDGAPFVDDYWSVSENTPSTDVVSGGRSSIFGITGSQDAGVTIVSWARNLTTGDSKDVDWTIGTNNIIVAYADSDSLAIQHVREQSATIQIVRGNAPTLGSSSSQPLSASSPGKTSHGVLMVIGWGQLTLLGSIVARYGKIALPAPKWFKIHLGMQMIGFIVSVAGMAVIFATNSSHFSTPWHAQLGLAVMIGGFLQILMGIFRPQAPDANKKTEKTRARVAFEWIHGIWGKLLLVASIIAIFSGLVQLPAPLFVTIIFAVYIGTIFLLIVFKEIVSCCRKQ